MTEHRHTTSCCNDCGAHPAGTCTGCDTRRRNGRRAAARRERDGIMRDCGLVKVRGALGGAYWE